MSAPGVRTLTNACTSTAAGPATAQSASRPTQVFFGFQGSAGPPTRRPAIAAAGSPNAIIAHTAAAMGRYGPRKTRISRRTIAG